MTTCPLPIKKSVCRMSGPCFGYLPICLYINMGRFRNCLVDGVNKIDKFKNLKHQRRKTSQREFFFLMKFSIPFKKDWVLAGTPKSHKTIHHLGLCFGLFFLSTLWVGLSQELCSSQQIYRLLGSASFQIRRLQLGFTNVQASCCDKRIFAQDKFHSQFECHG